PSAMQAAWAGIELLRHPRYLTRVLAEQQAILGQGHELTFEALREMVALERAIQESGRLHASLIVVRQILQDFTYQQYVMPAGGLAMVSPAVSQRLPETFADPERYDPDRFDSARPDHRQAKQAVITYGGGRHACIGKAFTYLLVKAIWSALLRR